MIERINSKADLEEFLSTYVKWKVIEKKAGTVIVRLDVDASKRELEAFRLNYRRPLGILFQVKKLWPWQCRKVKRQYVYNPAASERTSLAVRG